MKRDGKQSHKRQPKKVRRRQRAGKSSCTEIAPAQEVKSSRKPRVWLHSLGGSANQSLGGRVRYESASVCHTFIQKAKQREGVRCSTNTRWLSEGTFHSACICFSSSCLRVVSLKVNFSQRKW